MSLHIEKIIREYIDKTIHMSLATANGNKPWVCEVHFVYDQELNLYFRSIPSRRHCQEIAKNPIVAGNIVRQHDLEDYPHAIYFEGTARRLSEKDEIENAYLLFKAAWGAGEEIVNEALTTSGHQIYEISVANWYAFGKFGGNKGLKYELKWKGWNK